MAWMALEPFDSWMMDNFATSSLKHVGSDESYGYSTLQLSNITIAFLPPSVTSVVQPLDQVLIALFKVQDKKKLL